MSSALCQLAQDFEFSNSIVIAFTYGSDEGVSAECKYSDL